MFIDPRHPRHPPSHPSHPSPRAQMVDIIDQGDLRIQLNSLNPRFPTLSNDIITECVNIVITSNPDIINPFNPKIKKAVVSLARTFNYYIQFFDSQLKDNIQTPHNSLTGLSDTLKLLDRSICVNPTFSSQEIVETLVKDKQLPTQTGGQKIRKYRKTRTKPSKSNIRNKRRMTRRRRHT